MNTTRILAVPLAMALTLVTPNPAVAAEPTSTLLSSTLNLQENDNAYSVRLEIPENIDVNVRLAGSTLVLESASTRNEIRHEQRISLPQAQANAALGIKRDGSQLVISIPKGNPGSTSSSLPTSFAQDPSFDNLRDQVLSQAANMLRQMGSEESSAADAANSRSPQDLFGTLLGSIAPQLQGRMTASEFNLDDRGDAYLITATLPEEQARNVSVNVDNERAITITSRNEKKTASGRISSFSAGTSTQSMALPSPVRGEEMKMDYKNGRLEIVLPKK